MPTPASPPDQQLLQTLKNIAWPLDEVSRSKIQGHVCAFVDEKRAEGWSIERVIVSLKMIVEDAGLFRADASGAARLTARNVEQLITTLVTWCIDHYYRPLPPTDD